MRKRTRKTKGCLSRNTALSTVFKLMLSAKKKWRKLSGTNRLPEVIQGVEFKDGIKQRSKYRLITPSPTFGHNSCRRSSWKPRTGLQLTQGRTLCVLQGVLWALWIGQSAARRHVKYAVLFLANFVQASRFSTQVKSAQGACTKCKSRSRRPILRLMSKASRIAVVARVSCAVCIVSSGKCWMNRTSRPLYRVACSPPVFSPSRVRLLHYSLERL